MQPGSVEIFKVVNTRIITAGLCVQFLGLTFIVLITLWVSIYLHGASLIGDKQQLINLHAIFMPTSLIFLEGNGIIIYRTFKGYTSRDVKYLHYGIQTLAFIMGIFGYIAIFMARETHVSNFYSLHSWLGLIVIMVFMIEFFGGIYFYHSKDLSRKAQELSGAFHAFFGLFNCILAIWVACLGLTTLSMRTILVSTHFTIPSMLVNFSGLAMIFYGALVFYICTDPDFEWDKTEARLGHPQFYIVMYLIAAEIVSHVLGLIFIILLCVWTDKHLGGLSISDDFMTMINTHIVLMPIGTVYITGTSMTLFRLFNGYSTKKVKYLHVLLHIIGSVFSIFGFFVIFSARLKQDKIPHFYSLHSWVALIVIISHLFQHIGGLLFFTIFPLSDNLNWRDKYATAHAFCGLFGFLSAGVAANIGIMAKAFFSVLTYATLDESTLLANFSGLFIALYGATIFYICVNPYFEWTRTD